MNLGAFSISLNVSDLAASRSFYELLGFSEAAGNEDENWLIMRNENTTIGLFHGMFDNNILTFNPGMGQDMSPRDDCVDVREVQARLLEAGIALGVSIDDGSSHGAGHIVFSDPDGNVVMIDQFS
ncbi:MAG: VOC family protein [Acidimicrobiales bacterium]|nr:VOC family protein [Acidimicrobiales bacterium]